ncbi:MAG: hypothetical protein KC684_10760, partial [Candidatus Omnitrophica bacterium]|nr:hypothetical protein [Candidatus Omnitrophota bacterium]
MEQEITDITNTYLGKTRYKLIDLLIKGEKKNRIVEIFVDSVDPVSLDDLSIISKDLNQILSESELNSSLSKLVVSSPGVDKPFKFMWQLKKHIGRTLEIQTNEGEKIEAKLDGIPDEEKLLLTKKIK